MNLLTADPSTSDTNSRRYDGAPSPAASSLPTARDDNRRKRPLRPRASLTSDVLASGALALFSIAVAAGFARTFSGWTFLDNLVVLAIAGHGVGFCARRIGLPAWLSIPLVTVVLFWSIGMMFYANTYSWGFPSGDTWTIFSAEFDLVREQFSVAVPPVVDGGGWDVLAAIGMALAVALADAFAFGALARAESLVPGGVLFVFIAALGDDRLRVPLTVALVASGVVATVLLRAHHAPGGITTGRGRAPARVVIQAVLLAAVVALSAGAVGQRLPGATAEPLFDTRGGGGGGGDGDGTAVSPLVDIRSRLTNNSDAELFVVQANAESYWRSATLANFDGRTWGLPDRPLDSSRADAVAIRPTDQEIRQQIRVVQLSGALVPAAPDPVAASGPNDLRFDGDTSMLVTRQSDVSTGDTFQVVSASPRFDPAVLAAATSIDPGDHMYLELPDDFPDVARRLASQVTAGATSSYEAALLLQNWFQSEFSYSLEVQPGHGNNAIEGFLRERIGYCEQFAGTYAAMMRSIGVPSRVSVGFTTGRPIAANSYSVAGRNAHAWPEVWFDDVGWVLFEPTPGRGAPGTENYTGVAPEQDTSSGGGPNPGAESNPADAPTPTIVSPRLPEAELDPGDTDGSQIPELSSDPQQSASSGAGLWLGGALVAALGVAVASPAVVRRVGRRAAARTPDDQLAIFWQRALVALGDVGVPIKSSDTPTETAQLTVQTFPIAARPMRSLADAVTTATYRAEGSEGFDVVGAYGSSPLRDSAHWTRQIERAVADSVTTPTRIKRYFTRWR